MGIQPILPITVPVKKIKSTARQCYSDGDGVVWCEQSFKGPFTADESEGKGENCLWCLPFILWSFLLVVWSFFRFRLVWIGPKFETPWRHTLKSQSAQSVPDRRTDRTFTFKSCLHVTFFTPFFSSFKNGFNELLSCCSHMTLKYVKKDQRFPWQKRCEKRYV